MLPYFIANFFMCLIRNPDETDFIRCRFRYPDLRLIWVACNLPHSSYESGVPGWKAGPMREGV